MSKFEQEINSGKRFQFGKNWSSYLSLIDEERIAEAETSLKHLLEVDSLAGQRFLDAGSGSGLFSLAARRLGATVTSFDYDPDSVQCTQRLKDRFNASDDYWNVVPGSVLDAEFISSLGQFDIVYSWGVLHHTGDMWRAMDILQRAVKRDGRLLMMIYLDLGWKSHVWTAVKRTYCSGPVGRAGVLATFIPYYLARGVVEDFSKLKNPLTRYREYKRRRGMSRLHDWVDWLGGYPYEYATPAQVAKFCEARGLLLLRNCSPAYVFVRASAAA